MAKFHLRPIEAEQFLADGTNPTGLCPQVHDYRPHIHTAPHNETVALRLGDWIVADPDGVHFYVIHADEFARLYDPADRTTPLAEHDCLERLSREQRMGRRP